MAYEYYDFLGIDRYTDKNDINRACKRKRRALTIDDDNEGLQYLNQVQQTLLDDHSRVSYDEMQEFGDNISELLETASEQMEKEEWEDATRSLKQLLALAPKQVVARNLLGICYTREGEYDEAIKIYDKLLAECPDTPLYWANAGYVYSEKSSEYPLKLSDGQLKSECPNCEEINFLTTKNRAFVYKCEHCEKSYLISEETKDMWLAKAREYYLKAVDLEPYNHEYYINVATTYDHELLYQQAVDWIEKGISADGKIDFDDFDDLFYLCRIYSHMDKPDKMLETAKRIELLVPVDIDEAREYAAYRFLKFAHELSEINIFDVAARFAKCALVINSKDKDISACYEYYNTVADALEEYDLLMEDNDILNPIKRLASLSLAVAYEEKIEDRDGVISDILHEFGYFSDNVFKSSLNRLKKQYNGIYRLDKEFYDDCEKSIISKNSPLLNSQDNIGSDSERGVCRQCIRTPLKSTLRKTGGLCMYCYNGNNSNPSNIRPQNANTSNGGCGCILILLNMIKFIMITVVVFVFFMNNVHF
jgi:tetratricopeptide (TPR) repeat protein